MLTRTFCHLPRLTSPAERRLWAAGVTTWAQLASSAGDLFRAPRARLVREWLAESERRLAQGDAAWFAGRLKPQEHWRLFPHFRAATVFLDIETTGLSPVTDQVTTVAVYDGRAVTTVARDRDLDRLSRLLADHDVVVTYNGKCFDAPFLARGLGVHVPPVHLDLRYLARAVGLAGGLKAIERRLGFSRGDLADVDGMMAVWLWHDHRAGNPHALDTLLAYNVEDTTHLEALMVEVYNRHLAAAGAPPSLRLPAPRLPPNPHHPHRPTLERLGASRVASW